MAAITVDRLRKDYGDLHAVDGLSFTVAAGEVFALLGPNGAGKTTTVEILEGHRHRTAGQVDVLGFDPETGGRPYRERIGIVLHEAGFDADFTVRELIRHTGALYPRRLPVGDVIDLVGLAEKRDARVKTLSGRAAPPARPGPGSGRRPGPALPRRAHDRVRPVRAPPGVGADREPACARQGGAVDHPLPGRGGTPRRPGRRGGVRQADRLGRSRRDRGCRPRQLAGRLPGDRRRGPAGPSGPRRPAGQPGR